MCMDVSKCVWMCLNVYECVCMCLNVYACVCMCMNVSKCVWMCINVRTLVRSHNNDNYNNKNKHSALLIFVNTKKIVKLH